jgi:hypothetical protein
VVSETYTRGGAEETTAGGIMMLAFSVLSAILVIAALLYAAGTGQRHKAALAAAGCEPNLSPSGFECTTVWMLARDYTAITNPADQQLSADVAAYTASQRHNLAAAEAALTAEVTAENALATSLARFPFPPAMASTASVLVRNDRGLASLTAEQARSSSLARMRSFNGQVRAASAVVQHEMLLLHQGFESPPTASEEP